MKLTITKAVYFLLIGGSGAATCGGGSRGDGICANGTCCSQVKDHFL